MLFSTLADYFEQLEKTSSRLQLIDILSNLFKRVESAEEAEKICYLVQGRIAPFFEALEIGMAEKTVATSIAQAYGVEREEVLMEFDKLGDMGLVVERFSPRKRGPVSRFPPASARSGLAKAANELRAVGNPSTSATPRLFVLYVFKVLTEIAKISGDGTVEKKITLLADLLKRLDSISAKYLARIPLGNLRLGIGDPTVLDALAKAKLGDKSQRHYLEGAYNRTSDLGLIAKTLWGAKNPVKAVEAVEKLEVTVSKPIRSELCERLTTPEKVIEKMGEVDVQPKYDGIRCQVHKNGNDVWLFSRNLENMTRMFPELIEGARKQIIAHSAILDTETLAYNPESEEFLPFQETTKRRRKYKIEETAKQLPLKAFVFDILYKNGKSLLNVPLQKRLEILKETVESDDVLFPAKNQVINEPKKLALMLEDSISKGLEGVVVKKLNSFYEAGARNFNWVKLKRHSAGELKDTIDCVILGYIFGRGKRTAFGAGALLAGVYDEKRDMFVTVTKIGTGLSDAEWISIKQRTKNLERRTRPARVESLITPSVWVEPEIVIEVLADEITRSPIHTAGYHPAPGSAGEKAAFEPGYALRFPRLVSFRDKDKKPEDATTVKELIEMYKEQGKK